MSPIQIDEFLKESILSQKKIKVHEKWLFKVWKVFIIVWKWFSCNNVKSKHFFPFQNFTSGLEVGTAIEKIMSNFFTSRRNFLFLKISLETKKKLKFWNFFRSTYHEMRLQCTYFQFQWKKNQNFGLFYFKWIFREFLYFHPMVGFPIAVQIKKKNLYYCNLRKNITIVASPPDPIVRWGWGSTISLTVSQWINGFSKFT